MDHMEDHMQGVWTEWASLKDKWFQGEKMDPVFEGVVRDFCMFDATMQNIYTKVGTFMKGVDQLSAGMISLSDGVSKGLQNCSDHQISSDSCKLKEATNQICRADAPHSAVAKLRRDMHFNIITPIQNHIANNRNLKVSLDIRRRRLVEVNGAKKLYDDCVKRGLTQSDRRFITAQSNFEAAKTTFNDVDRHVFEWLYILEEYRGDILDSTLQTLKYLQYEFFATSAHAISTSLPSRMEFRPMVEMTPEHLEAQVEMELAENEEAGNTEAVQDFSVRLIEKKARDDPSEAAPLPVDPLSLSSLLSQGFDEGPARQALRRHQNNTQAAMDWLINGDEEVVEKQKAVSEGVRMPTTVKRVQKLKAMRKTQAEKQRRVVAEREADRDRDRDKTRGPTSTSSSSRAQDSKQTSSSRRKDSDDEDDDDEEPEEVEVKKLQKPAPKPAPVAPAPPTDLLNLDEEPPPPEVCGGIQVARTPLPMELAFEDIRCEKPPLTAALSAGIAQPRQEAVASTAASDLMAQVQALAAQSSVTPEQLMLAAQQLQAQQAAPAPVQAPSLAQLDVSSLLSNGSTTAQVANPGFMMQPAVAAPAASGFASLDPFAMDALAAPAPAAVYAAVPAPVAPAPSKPEDKFGDLVNLG